MIQLFDLTTPALVILAIAPCALGQTYTISTVAGGAPPPSPVSALNASIGSPRGAAVDTTGNVYFGALNCIFKLDKSGVLTRVAGNGRNGYSGDGGLATNAQLSAWVKPAVDRAGNIYIADQFRVRKVSLNGIITTVAGNGGDGYSGDGGPATSAAVIAAGVAVDGTGNIYIADGSNFIRKVSSGTGIITRVAGVGGQNGYSGDGGQAINAQLGNPTGLLVDGSGNLYIADTYN